MRKLARRCRVSQCEKAPFLGGFCEAHHIEEQAKSRRRNEAVELLHRGIVDNDPLRIPEWRDELIRLQGWWERACRELKSPGTDSALQDEAEFAVEWCITLAEEMVDAERSVRSGNPPTSSQLERTRDWVWERFRNLERGLMSNGVRRP